MQKNIQLNKNEFVIIKDDSFTKNSALSEDNIKKLNLISQNCIPIIILITTDTLICIAELNITFANNTENVILKNGIRYRLSFAILLKSTKEKKLGQYFAKLQSEQYGFDQKELREFVQLATNPQNYLEEPKVNYVNGIPGVYEANLENPLFYIDSPILRIKPELHQLEECPPLDKLIQVSNNLNIYKRVTREIQEVNKEFFSLRTMISPDKDNQINIFNFMMFPNDGAFCSLPLVGRIIIPESYPINPPIFHLFTRTNRYNLDVFNYAARSNNLESSSICFDIVKPISIKQSTWKPDYTISTVMASIMDVIVSYEVQQMSGGFKQQFVSMESLQSSYNNVLSQIEEKKNILNKLPKIPAIKAYPIMCKPINFKAFQKQNSYTFQKGSESLISDKIYLQKDYCTTQFFIDKLHPEFVLSFVLTNAPKDLQGNGPQTVLFRNGVTATAARKLYKSPMKWFYHGKPLNTSRIKLSLTITPNQFTISYIDDCTDDQWTVHGDTPISSMRPNVIGDMKWEFYLVIFVKNKNPNNANKFKIQNLKTTVGYIHSNSEYV